MSDLLVILYNDFMNAYSGKEVKRETQKKERIHE